MNNYITPNDFGIMAESDSISIQNAVDEAKKSGFDRVVIPRINERTGKPQWDVDKAVMLTSNLEIVLDNCYIRQIDGSMDNVFTNHIYRQPDTTVKGQQENIRIVGKGNAVIDGGVPNGLSEFTSLKDGNPHISKNNPILLHNIRGLVIDNITIKNQRWWGINLLYVEKARLSNINIDAQNNMRNQDGIDLRVGCHDIVIENIWGQSGDDLIALSAIGTGERKLYGVEGKDSDIHDIIIRNVVGTSAECAIIALRNSDGNKMYNISIDGVYDTLNGVQNKDYKTGNFFLNKSEKFLKIGAMAPYAVVRIGQHEFFSERVNEPGEIYGIRVSNIFSRCNNAIMINVSLQDSYFSNIYGAENVTCLISTSSEWDGHIWGVDMKNVTFENLYFPNANDEAWAFDYRINREEKTFENVYIKNAFLGRCKKILNMEHKGQIVIDGVFVDDFEDAIIENKNGAKVVINGKVMI